MPANVDKKDIIWQVLIQSISRNVVFFLAVYSSKYSLLRNNVSFNSFALFSDINCVIFFK